MYAGSALGHVKEVTGMSYDVHRLRLWIDCAEQQFRSHLEALNALDAAIGDGDHGTNLTRGFGQVLNKIKTNPPSTPAGLFKQIGMTLISSVGGASGPLYGTFFLEAAKAAGDQPQLSEITLAQCLQAGLMGIQKLGKAEIGDKTMVDALSPAVASLNASSDFAEAALKAHDGLATTIPLVAHKGRASYLGERAIGHADPGATSSAMLFDCLAGI